MGNHMGTQTLKKLGLRPGDVTDIIGSRKLREEMEEAGWFHPVVQRHRLTIYNADDVSRAWARILAGEVPVPKFRGAADRSKSSITPTA